MTTGRRGGRIHGSPLPFLNGFPNFLLDPGRGGRGSRKSPPPQLAAAAVKRDPPVVPVTVSVSLNRHPCEARTTPARIASWASRATKLRPQLIAAYKLYPRIKEWDGAPLLLHFGLESDWTTNAVSSPETKAADADDDAATVSRSWGIGQVIDVNFPRIYQARNAADRVMIPPPSLDAKAIQGADLSRAGFGASGLHYAAQWLQNAALAYLSVTTTPDRWPLLTYAQRDLPPAIQRAIFLRLWAGGSSVASVERRVVANYHSIRPCAERVAAALPAAAGWF